MKKGLPQGALRTIAFLDEEEPHRLEGAELSVARVLALRGYLELLPGCTQTYGVTDKGRDALEDAAQDVQS